MATKSEAQRRWQQLTGPGAQPNTVDLTSPFDTSKRSDILTFFPDSEERTALRPVRQHTSISARFDSSQQETVQFQLGQEEYKWGLVRFGEVS
jgi:hypothetical protein